MSSRGFHGSSAGLKPESNRLCGVVACRTETVTGAWDLFRLCFEQGDLFGARRAFGRFAEALETLAVWEQGVLVAEAARRRLVTAGELAPLARQHLALRGLTLAIGRALAELEGTRGAPRWLARAVERLEALLAMHWASELHEVCCRLGTLLPEGELAAFERDARV